jgi:hypothetical protein
MGYGRTVRGPARGDRRTIQGHGTKKESEKKNNLRRHLDQAYKNCYVKNVEN